MCKIQKNIEKINGQISQACLDNDRQNSVTLLAVSKTKPATAIEQAHLAGQKNFGENYCQEALEKIAELAHLPDICWHFIGPIQSNKTKQIAENFSWVHSVDRAKVAQRLNNHLSEQLTQANPQHKCQDTALNICLQVNISEEASKAGVLVSEVFSLANVVDNCDNLTLRGLMAIPAKNADNECYQIMQHLFTQLQSQYPSVDTLSMGMSSDLDIAIANGATMVRIGTAIFGQRAAKPS